MQHTYHTYIPGSYQAFPTKVASIRADTAASNKEQSFHDYSSSYGSLGKLGIAQSKHGHGKHADAHSDASHKTSHDANGAATHGDSEDYHHFMPDFLPQGSGGDKGSSSGFGHMHEDYKKYMNGYDTNGPSNKYVPNLDRLREDEHSDFIPSGYGQQPAAAEKRILTQEEPLVMGGYAQNA